MPSAQLLHWLQPCRNILQRQKPPTKSWFCSVLRTHVDRKRWPSCCCCCTTLLHGNQDHSHSTSNWQPHPRLGPCFLWLLTAFMLYVSCQGGAHAQSSYTLRAITPHSRDTISGTVTVCRSRLSAPLHCKAGVVLAAIWFQCRYYASRYMMAMKYTHTHRVYGGETP